MDGSNRGAQDADNIWCPVLYEGHRGWANGYYLADQRGERIACGRDLELMEDKMPESVIAAAIAKLEAEKQSPIEDKIAKGEAVRVPSIVVGSPASANAEKARRLAELRAAGETREVIFGFKPADGSDAREVIVTGVPRAGRD
jgi:hypothetical protein